MNLKPTAWLILYYNYKSHYSSVSLVRNSEIPKFFKYQDVMSGSLREGSFSMRRSHCAADTYYHAPTCPGLLPDNSFFPGVIKNKNWLFILAFYEFLCNMKVYSIGIPKSKNIQNLKLFQTEAFGDTELYWFCLQANPGSQAWKAGMLLNLNKFYSDLRLKTTYLILVIHHFIKFNVNLVSYIYL
jgi:hypothetical protein